jgi:hypothetical protein
MSDVVGPSVERAWLWLRPYGPAASSVRLPKQTRGHVAARLRLLRVFDVRHEAAGRLD